MGIQPGRNMVSYFPSSFVVNKIISILTHATQFVAREDPASSHISSYVLSLRKAIQ